MLLLKSSSTSSIFYLNLLFLCIRGYPAFPNIPLHKQMNSSFLKRMLNVSYGDEAPKYEFVQLRILSKRSTDDEGVIRVHLSAFGKDLHLRLQRNDDFSSGLKTVKVFEATLTESGVRLSEVTFEEDDPGTPYIDPVHMAAVTIRHDPDGKLQMDGVIGDDLVIEPAPPNINFLADFFAYDENFKGNGTNSFEEQMSNFLAHSSSATSKSGVHIVYRSLMKTKASLKGHLALDDALNSIDSTDGGWRRHKNMMHAWPEVLLMVDSDSYDMHVSHGFDDAQIRRYYISFLNGVDLRFKALSDPKMSLILSQIVLFKSRDATPYLKDNLYSYKDMFNGNKAISDFAHHLYSSKVKDQRFFRDFDLAILLTKLDMCTEETVRCNPATVGLAYFMGACTVTPYEERWMGVAIVEDNGGYDGILTAAHEIGHLLGADHDGSPEFRGGPKGAFHCSHEDGYIMSHKVTSDRIFQWSECSIKQFRHFLNSGEAACLFNKPNYHNELEGSEFPGAVLSLDEQCKRIWGARACASDSRVCLSLHCIRPDGAAVETCLGGLPPAAEGSSCGKDLHCRHGKCVSNSVIYSPAWKMAPVHDSWKQRNSLIISSTKKTLSSEEACAENSDEAFCDYYFWNIDSGEACQNSRIIEECCYSQKVFCHLVPYRRLSGHTERFPSNM